MNEAGKRLDGTERKGYTTIDELPEDWASYEVQEIVNEEGSPTETTIQLMIASAGRDITCAVDKLAKKAPDIVEKGLEEKAQAPDTVSVDDYRKMKDVEMVEF